MIGEMGTAALLSLTEYLSTSFRPDCDFVAGEVVERNVGKKKHSYAQFRISAWFFSGQESLRLEALPALRMKVAPEKVRIPDIVLSEIPLPEEEVFTTPPYLCVEIMSPDDTMFALQERLDDYLRFGVEQIWVVDPWQHRGWRVTAQGWLTAEDGVMRTSDGRVAMPLADVLLP
jgi:Uma2 family endonuclease